MSSATLAWSTPHNMSAAVSREVDLVRKVKVEEMKMDTGCENLSEGK